jgi:hypothetical protein
MQYFVGMFFCCSSIWAYSQTPIFSLDLLLHTLPLMETIGALLKFGQRQDVFINNFVVVVKVYHGQLYKLYCDNNALIDDEF